MRGPGTRIRTAPQAQGNVSRSSDGVVLISVLLLLAFLALATGASLGLLGVEFWVVTAARAARQATYTAEAGVLHTLAAIAPGGSFAAVRSGGGGWTSMDAAPLGGGEGGRVWFPGPPFGYRVDLEAMPPGPDGSYRVRVVSEGTAVRGARVTLHGVIGRGLRPWLPAALVVTGGDVRVHGELRVDGGGGAAVAHASPFDVPELVDALDAGRLRLAGPVLPADGMDLASFVGEALDGVGEDRGGDVQVLGDPTRDLGGAGVALARGDLRLSGRVAFRGALLVAGDLRVESDVCRVDGIVWARSIEVSGRCSVAFLPAAIEHADSLVRLPRRPVLLAIQPG